MSQYHLDDKHTYDEDIQAAKRENEECSDKIEVVNMMAQNGRAEEALEDTKCTNAEVCAQHREVLVEESIRPSAL